MKFSEDKNIEDIAKAYALDAVDFASSHFAVRLDFSDKSINQVELILDKLHQSSLQDSPSDEQIFRIAKMFGSYVGEVYRCNHGAEWGMVTENKESFPGLRSIKTNDIFWPWGKINNRISNGCEDNVLDYYQRLIKK